MANSRTPVLDHVRAPDGGRIGLVRCPGTIAPGNGLLARPPALGDSLAELRAWPAAALVSLIERWELDFLGVANLGAESERAGLEWFHLPIIDMSAPDRRFADAWPEVGPRLHARLDAGENLVVHCRAGLGRSGTVAALLLIERGVEVRAAIRQVRGARPGAIEAAEQETWLVDLAGDNTR
jgi:protein-tyrosine phosphatase